MTNKPLNRWKARKRCINCKYCKLINHYKTVYCERTTKITAEIDAPIYCAYYKAKSENA